MTASLQFPLDMGAEIRLGGGIGYLMDLSQAPEFFEGERLVELTVVVEGAVESAVDEHAAVAQGSAVRKPVKCRGAIREQRVVPAGDSRTNR